MKSFGYRWVGVLAFTAYLVLLSSPAARAEEMTAKTLIDRAAIQDLITRYYDNFGKPNRESFADFYADDAELILGADHFKGKDGINEAYRRAGANTSVEKAYSFNITISNLLIVVHGERATAKLLFTEYLMQKQGDTPSIRTQGWDYATFVKVKGQWRYRMRQIVGGNRSPDGWQE